MIISMIAAMAKNRVIGKDNAMPWHIPEELSYFKKVTMGKPIVMGRNTFESIGRPLPGRQNIVLTTDKTLTIKGVTIANSIEEAISLAGDCNELMIIGGARLYEQCLVKAQRLYLTEIDLSPEGDAYFPNIDENAWIKHDKVEHVSSNGTKFSTYTLNLKE